jgi:hypothetical protein
MPPLYKSNEFEILRTRYVEQAAHIRDMNHLEFKYFTAFIAAQILLVGWLSSRPPTTFAIGLSIAAADWAMFVVCLYILRGVTESH